MSVRRWLLVGVTLLAGCTHSVPQPTWWEVHTPTNTVPCQARIIGINRQEQVRTFSLPVSARKDLLRTFYVWDVEDELKQLTQILAFQLGYCPQSDD